MAFPTVVTFEGIGPCYYTLGDFRAPRKGEYYLSGAIVEAWKAPNDLSTAFRIVRPTFHAKQARVYVLGAPVVPDEQRDRPALNRLERAAILDPRD